VTPVEIVATVLILFGAFFGIVAAIGVIRLPDIYTRAHATSKSDTLGILLSLIGVALIFGTGVTAAKTVLLAVFMFVTNPTAAHAISRAAYDQNITPWFRSESEE
jgi:monovalent cation/proton antiporter, MnhG/PhaG subunit